MSLPATIGGKYNVVQRLGKGGMGTVFEALVSGTGERVAVKVIAADLADDESIVMRFQREARTAASLDTPHIVKVIEAGIDEATHLPFMAMEYLEGEDLRQLLKRLGPLPSSLALRIAAQACRALEAAHAAKILHRDIKPANLFIARQGGERVVKLLDFGVAKMQHSELTGDAEQTNLTRTGSMIGSPLYMSPEQARGYRDIDGRSDLWSLGVVLYQMLCGKTPHKKIDELGELLVRICTEPPPPLRPRAPWVPPYIANLVHRSVAMSPDARFQSAAAMLEALGELMPEGTSITELMLRPLSDHERAISAELSGEIRIEHVGREGGEGGLGHSGSHPGRFSQSVPAVMAIPGFAPSAVPDSPTVPTGPAAARAHSTLTIAATTTGITAPTAVTAPPPKRKSLTIAAAVLLSAAAAAAVFLGLMREPEPAPAANGSAGAKETGEPRPRSVNVVVLPEEAKIELDGAAAKVEDGIFEITGTMGSVHKVKISLGQATKSVDVVITENGASPPKIELEAAAPTTTATAAARPTQAPLFGPRPQPATTRTATPAATTKPAIPALRDDR